MPSDFIFTLCKIHKIRKILNLQMPLLRGGVNKMKIKLLTKVAFATLVSLAAVTAQAAQTYLPFALASNDAGTVADKIAGTKTALTENGFEIAGEYSPYKGAHIIVVTNDELKKAAASKERGGYIAAQRIALTEMNGKVQVSYTNPNYFGAVFQMESDLSGVSAKLASALGNKGEYGPESGLSADDLGDYQYKWLMPHFTDRLELAEYDNQDKAVSAVAANLKAGKGGTAEVYRIDVPGQEATVFGVAMKGTPEECAGDEFIMNEIDFKDTRSTGHLPYEIVVKDGVAYALPAEFRIAISFPDLAMMGDNSFMNIMCAPGAIQATLEAAAGGNS